MYNFLHTGKFIYLRRFPYRVISIPEQLEETTMITVYRTFEVQRSGARHQGIDSLEMIVIFRAVRSYF